MAKTELEYNMVKGIFERMFFSSISGASPLSAEEYHSFSSLTMKQVMTMQDFAILCKKYEDAYNKSSSKFHWSLNHARQYRDLRDEFVKRLQVFNNRTHINTSSANIHSGRVIRLISSEETAITLQEDHINSLRSCSTKKKSCRWIHLGETFEVNGHLLTKGFFYIGEYFKIPQSYRLMSKFDVMNRKYRDYNRCYKLLRIYGPVLQKELPISQGNLQIVPFSSYLDMHPTHRFEYIEWLKGNKSVSQISTETFLFYLFGLQLRMFIDEDTTEQDRLDIVKYSIELFVQCKNENVFYQELVNFIDASISKYFADRLIELAPKIILPHLPLSCESLIFNSLTESKDKSIEDILMALCNSILSILNSDETIPSHLLGEDFCRNFVINVYYNLSKRTTYVGSKLVSILDVLKKTSKRSHYEIYCLGYNKQYLKFYYDYIFSFLLSPNSRDVKYVINSFTACFKDVVKQLKEFKAIYTISPTLALIKLPSIFCGLESKEVLSFIDFLSEKTKEQEYAPININEILCFGKNVKIEHQTISKSQITLILNCLKTIGYNLSPDVQLNEEVFSFGDCCILYRKGKESDVEQDNKYETLLPVLKVAAFIIGEGATSIEKKVTDDFIKQNVRSNESIRHLKAYFRWRLLNPVLSPNDYKIIKKIGPSMKEELSTFFVHLAYADRTFSSKEQEKLAKILTLIDVNPQTMHSMIHRLSTEENEFAAIEKTDDALDFTIDKETNSHSISLNDERLVNVEIQTTQAQKILSDIFASDEEKTELSVDRNTIIINILKILFSKATWKRNEVDSLCQKYQLLTGSVLEQINDFSYSKIEDVVIEDDGETIYVMTDYKDKLI